MNRTASSSPRRTGATRARATRAPSRDDLELAALAKALGHPVRVAIVRRLLEHGECVCGALVDRLPLAQSTVSQHLKVLKSAGLIRGELDPPRVCYCIDPAAIRRLKERVNEL